MQLSAISLALTRAGYSIFTPSSIFTTGVNGAWYDPSDINLTWRRNLLTYSEQFDNAAWTKTGITVTPNTDVAPDGTTTADTVTFSSSNLVTSAISNTPVFGRVVTGSVYIAGTAGETIQIAAGGVDQLVTLTGEWQRFTATKTAITDTTNAFNINTYGGATARTIKVWGAQLELGSTATPYQRITDGVQDYLQYQAQPVLFQNAAGTTPVTAVEQPVGLMLDKSKGLVLGSELVTNGDFSNGTTGWTAQSASLSVVSGQLVVVPSTTFGYAYQAITTVVGTTYKITFSYDQGTAAIARYFVGTSVGDGSVVALTTVSGTGTISRYFTATSTTTYLHFGAQNSSGQQALFDNISLKSLPGNHAFNGSGNSANFPVLSARYNLLTKTEDFSDAAWTKTFGGTGSIPVVTPNAGTAPDGTNTADRIVFNKGSGATTADYSLIGQAGINAGSTCKGSVYVKSYTGSTQTIMIYVVQSASVQVSTLSVGSEWVQISATSSFSITAGGINIGTRGGAAYGGDNTLDLLVWGADLRVSNDGVNLPAYQRVNTSTDYDSSAVWPRYLRFNGTNQWLQTNSIDFSYGDKMFVSAGVRKLSDATAGAIVELATSISITGYFGVRSRAYASGDYALLLRGLSGNTVQNYITYTAPITNVLSGLFDQAGTSVSTELSLRVNGSVSGTGATTLGPNGNTTFANASLFIGATGGAGTWFNGRLYGMVVAGKQASAAEITSTETYLNQKTGAF